MDQLLEMSAKELSRLEVMQRLSKKQMSQAEAGRILSLSVRQIKCLLKTYRKKGAAGLVSKQRGNKANNREQILSSYCAFQLSAMARPTVCVTCGWAGRGDAVLPEPTLSRGNSLKTRRVPPVGCTPCWAFGCKHSC